VLIVRARTIRAVPNERGYFFFRGSAKIRSSNRCAVRGIVRCVLELGGAIQFRIVGNDTPSISASSAELTRKVSRAFRNVRACLVSFVAIMSPLANWPIYNAA